MCACGCQCACVWVCVYAAEDDQVDGRHTVAFGNLGTRRYYVLSKLHVSVIVWLCGCMQQKMLKCQFCDAPVCAWGCVTVFLAVCGLCACMSACVRVRLSVLLCLWACACIPLCLCAYECMYVCLCAHVGMYVYLYACVRIYVWMYELVCACMYVLVCVRACGTKEKQRCRAYQVHVGGFTQMVRNNSNVLNVFHILRKQMELLVKWMNNIVVFFDFFFLIVLLSFRILLLFVHPSLV